MRGTVVSGWFQRKPSGQEQVVGFLVQWLITAAAVWVAAELLGGIHLEGWKTTLIVALILGALNAFLKPLMVLGALPAVMITMGLFLVVIN
ncbi:MAG: phage holin family protein, partial [Dehalococcoidia bacterium]